LYQCFKRQLKTPTCFGSFAIHRQRVLNVLDWNYLWYFCVRSRCLAAAKHRLHTQKYHK